MILTLTPNPSQDKTVELPAALTPGAVQRATGATAEPGGKGVNISRALCAANSANLAVLPGDAGDPVLTGLTDAEVTYRALPLGQPLRTNITITDPQGVTTKINEPGPQFDAEAAAALRALTVDCATGAAWAALAGSLPPGMPQDFYAQLIGELRRRLGAEAPKIAVDSSGTALAAAVTAAPELIKPNAEELLELAGTLSDETSGIGADALEEDPVEVLRLVRMVQDHGVQTALVTLGAYGALLVPPKGSATPVLRATGPAVVARSTVGAGDASLAGYLLADASGAGAEEALRRASAQGRAAAALPGSVMPTPDDLDLTAVVIEPFKDEPFQHEPFGVKPSEEPSDGPQDPSPDSLANEL
ncbi:1-phosphofructokinase family hexose kinase [Nesterenkonia aerolata]|uniref:Hexose kinase n=1 Tax=Nesterenkonia aerolata TaxID=3074079 RepID=A0ABU2DQG1_9MICC|nr:hexose kinase [Nesterenkonia sp. LY-0111]MDR8018744.1 hexose kinase [Nesterenkonia sp. LY-0111]